MSHQRAHDRWLTIEPEHAPVALPIHRRSRRNVAVPQPRNPLSPTLSPPVLLPIIGANDELLPALEERLHSVAVRAKEGDRVARNGLYAAFEPKLIRIARRLNVPPAFGTDIGIWGREDIYQEAFIAFAELIDTWTVTIPFGRYILANIPWRLRDAVYRGVGKRGVPPHTYAVAVEDAIWLADDSVSVEVSKLLIAIIGEALPSPRGRILYAHLCDGRTLTDIARDLGVSRRTVTRHWTLIRQHLVEGWRLSGLPSEPRDLRGVTRQ